MIRVLLYEDNPELRNSLAALIGGTEGLELAGAFPDCVESGTQVSQLKPDVVLMDIDMPGMSGLQGLEEIKKKFPDVNVLMLTVFDDDENVFRAIRSGATGYLLKKTAPAKILEAIIEAKDGGAPMTPTVARKVLELFSGSSKNKQEEFLLTSREQEVLTLFVDGYSYKMAADELGISVFTVQDNVKSIYKKLHVHSMAAAVAMAIKHKIV